MPVAGPFVVLLPILGILAPMITCDIARNTTRKKKIFEEYAEHGILAPGLILRAKTIVRRSYTVETSRTHEVVFAYKKPNSASNEIVVKPKVSVSNAPTSRLVQVLVLPDLPNSGCLKETVDQRNGSDAMNVMRALFALVLHLIGVVVFMGLIFCWDDDFSCFGSSPCLPAIITSSILLHAISYGVAGWSFHRWRTKLLHTGALLSPHTTRGETQQRGTLRGYEPVSTVDGMADIPAAEVVAVLDGQDSQSVSLESAESGGAPAVALPLLAQDQNQAVVVHVEDTSVVELSFYESSKHDAASQKIREAVKTGDWPFLRDFFANIRGKNVERDFYARVIGSCLEEEYWKKLTDTFGPVLDRWAEEEPKNPDCSVVRGWCYISWAWFARGSGFANTVPADAWPKFHARIDQASHELKHTVELSPLDGLAFALLVVVARAEKGRDIGKMTGLLEGLQHSDDPNNLLAHKQILQFHCRKWGGSDDEMFAFARESTRELAEGDPLWILIIQAHYEVFLQLLSAANATRRPVVVAAASRYWSRPEVKQEILHSYQQYVGSSELQAATTAAEESVLLLARNWYAYSFVECGNAEMARRELLAIGRRCTEQPWNSVRRFQTACSKVGVSL